MVEDAQRQRRGASHIKATGKGEKGSLLPAAIVDHLTAAGRVGHLDGYPRPYDRTGSLQTSL